MSKNFDIDDKISIAELKKDVSHLREKLDLLINTAEAIRIETKKTNGRVTASEGEIILLKEKGKDYITKEDFAITGWDKKTKITVAIIGLLGTIIGLFMPRILEKILT